MALYRHWQKYPPTHIALALARGGGSEQTAEAAAFEEAVFSQEARPLSSLPPDVQQFIRQNG